MKTLVAAVLLVAGFMAWRSHTSDAPDAKLLFDRYWIDHPVRDIHEKFQALYVSGEHPFGNFAARTVWTGQWEGFHYHALPREDGLLEVIFPNNSEVQRVRYVARSCQESGFDFCLEVSGSSRGVRRYFSRKEWAGVSELRPSNLGLE